MEALTARSVADVAALGEQVTDSLGQMRRVGRNEALEVEMCEAARGWAILWMVSYHWLWRSGAMEQTGVSEMLVSFAKVCWADSGMLIFAIASALRDRATMSERMALQLKQDLFLVVLYFACHWPLPALLSAVWHHVLRNPENSIAVGSQHRWYLLFVVICRVAHHVYRSLAEKLQVRHPSWLLPTGVLVTLAVSCLAASATVPNLCPGGGVATDSWHGLVLRFSSR